MQSTPVVDRRGACSRSESSANPVDGELLVGIRGVPSKGSVPGFDLTFSAPKSVSLLWALGGAENGAAVSRAHDRSVRLIRDEGNQQA